MKFRVLGPVSAWGDGEQIPVGGPRQQCVLGALLVDLGREVSAERLTELLWGEEPPRTSRSVIHVLISHLRRRFPSLIHTSAGGYRADARPDDVDLHRFRRLADEAQASDDTANAVRLWDEALEQWQGKPFSGVQSDRVWYTLCVPLLEERWNALANWAEAAYCEGLYGKIAERLHSPVYEEPSRERLAYLLIAALYRNGDRAAAMSAYHAMRERLVDDLGIDPGPEILALYQEMLCESDGDTAAAPRAHAPAETAAAPAEPTGRRNDLPRDLPDFTGRENDLAWLLDTGDEARRQAVVRVVSGPGGAGKTTLVVHAAHRLAARYPDGVLFIDLYGYAVEREPLSASAALGSLLRAIGVEPEAIPESVDERGALWRSRMVERRSLIVLDNAVGYDQVSPLLCAAQGSLTLITTRHDLPGLSGVRHLTLDMLDDRASLDLFAAVLGPERVAAEPETALHVARLCGGLPLALRIVAGRMATRPRWTFAHVADRLGEQHRMLHELRADGRSVWAIFELSYQSLTEAQQHVFLRVGLMIGGSVDLHGAAALLDVDPPDADDALQELVSVCLIEERGVDLYRFHDLIGVYAREKAHTELAGDARATARSRQGRYYLETAQRAADWLGPRRDHMAEPAKDSRYDGPVVTSTQATAWFDTHQQNLAAAVDYFAEGQDSGRAWRLADALWRFYAFHAQTDLWFETHEKALAASRAQKDDLGSAVTMVGLGIAHCLTGRFASASRILNEARRIFVRIGDRGGEVRVLANLGMVYEREGRFRETIDVLTEVLEHCVQTGDRRLEVQQRVNIAQLRRVRGEFAEAIECCDAVLDTEGDDRFVDSRAMAARIRGEVSAAQGDFVESMRQLEYALAHYARLRYQTGEIYTRNAIAVTLRESGDVEGAIAAHRFALELGEKASQHSADAEILNALGDTFLRAGRPDDARECFDRALELAVERGERHAEGAALFGQAVLLRSAAGADGGSPGADGGEAVTGAGSEAGPPSELVRAVEIFTALEVPEAGPARAELALWPAPA